MASRRGYYAGSVRVATPIRAPKRSAGARVRTGGQTYYLLHDRLTSTAITANASGARVTELRYYAYGGTRYDAGGQCHLAGYNEPGVRGYREPPVRAR